MTPDAATTLPSLTRTRAVAMFLAFALAYFFSALVRAIVATLAPAFKLEFGIGPADLGLLAGAYFLGFAALQLPMGHWLDRHGPKRVLVAFLVLAVAGCAAFALAERLAGLIVARVAIGMGVAACLMAPLTAFRRWFSEAAQLRCSSWMLMTGSLGMLASTLPVQWLLPLAGWRGLFWALAAAFVIAALGIAWAVPRWRMPHEANGAARDSEAHSAPGYGAIWREPNFRALAPLAFFLYGGLVAVQTLWAGPWLTQVAGLDAAVAAQGLFFINAAMLATFFAWGSITPRLTRLGWRAPALVARGVPLALVLLAANVLAGAGATAPWWALWCVSCTVVSLSQPYVAQQVAGHLAGRALSAYNLVIFVGVFAVQWALGGLVQGLGRLGLSVVAAYQGAFALYWLCCALAYLWFLRAAPRGSLARGSVRNAAYGNDGRTGINSAPMASLLIVAHAPLATALQAVARHAFPDLAGAVRALDVEVDADASQLEARARALLGDRETLVLTDVFGATPANVAQRLADSPRVRVVAGVNVPMLWRALNYLPLPLEELVTRTLAGGTQGVLAVATTRPQNQALKTKNDPQQNHDQQ